MLEKVKVGEDYGTVIDFYDSLNGKVVVIDLDNGRKIKAYASEVEIVKEKPEKEKNTVTIDYESFKELVADKALLVSKGDTTIGLMYTLFGAILSMELFGEKADND